MKHAGIFRLPASAALVAVVLTLPLSACVVVRDDGYHPVPPPPPAHIWFDFWYYPHVSVYYDYRLGFYYYPSGGRWIKVRVLPPHLRGRLGSHVDVRSRDRDPWRHHEEHRRKHPPERFRPKPGPLPRPGPHPREDRRDDDKPARGREPDRHRDGGRVQRPDKGVPPDQKRKPRDDRDKGRVRRPDKGTPSDQKRKPRDEEEDNREQKRWR